MDIYCRVCGEPWSSYSDMEPHEWHNFIRGLGCPCCGGKRPEDLPKEISEKLDDIWLVLKTTLPDDDIDGMASLMEDLLGF